MENYELIGQGVGAAFLILASAYAVVRGHRKGDGNSPAERPPAPHEVKQALTQLHTQIERTGLDEQIAAALRKSLDGLAVALSRHADDLGSNTEACRDMADEISKVAAKIGKLATEMEIARALEERSRR